MAANNHAVSLIDDQRFKEARSLLRKTMPVAQRVLGECHDTTLRMGSLYAKALCRDPNATLDDNREAVSTIEDVGRIARRVLGGAHPLTACFEEDLRNARAALRAHDTE